MRLHTSGGYFHIVQKLRLLWMAVSYQAPAYLQSHQHTLKHVHKNVKSIKQAYKNLKSIK